MSVAPRLRSIVVIVLVGALLGGMGVSEASGKAVVTVPSSSARPAAPSPVSARYAHTVQGAYRWAMHEAACHYQVINCLPEVRVAPKLWGWIPTFPSWITEAGWWIKKGASCGIGVGSFVALGGTTKVATIVRKISLLAKTDKNIREARAAIRSLGGFAAAMRVLGRFAWSKGQDVTAVEKANVLKIVTAGGSVIANLLGVTACFEMVGRLL